MAILTNAMMMLIFIIAGISLFSITAAMSYKTLGCPNRDLQAGIQMLFIVSTAMITLSSAYFICKGTLDVTSTDAQLGLYMILFFFLGIGAISAGSLIVNALQKEKGNSDCGNVSSFAWGVIGAGIVCTLFSSAYGIYFFLSAKKNE
jgi:hypothetical protein